ncbi:MAG: DUF4364 family protein [Oscillospiraceae bacterium]|jgi:hypothetical protein|nr:DUF4364 family protein [Oscillospiraceae bacterium]
MARYGFTGSKEHSKLLILHILRLFDGTATRRLLEELFMLDDNADYFVFSEACAELLTDKLLTKGESGELLASETGLAKAALLETGLSVSLRRATAEKAAPYLERARRQRSVGGEAYTDEHGQVYACLRLSDSKGLLAELRLAAGDRTQAEAVIARWQSAAEELYLLLLERLT